MAEPTRWALTRPSRRPRPAPRLRPFSIAEDYGTHRLFVDFEPEHVRTGVVAHHVKIKLRSGEFGPVEVSHEDALFSVFRSGQELSQRPDDATSASDQNVLGRWKPFGAVVGGKIAPLKKLSGGQHKTAAFEGDVTDGGNPGLSVVHGNCTIQLDALGVHRRPQ